MVNNPLFIGVTGPAPQPAAMQLNSTPRVNFDLMQRYIGKKVKLVCQVRAWPRCPFCIPPECQIRPAAAPLQLEKVDANRAVVKTADGGTVYVTMKQAPTFETQFVEFDGIVESPTTLTETYRTPFGNSFGEHSALLLCFTLSAWQNLPADAWLAHADMNNYNELCRISVIDFPEVFV